MIKCNRPIPMFLKIKTAANPGYLLTMKVNYYMNRVPVNQDELHYTI